MASWWERLDTWLESFFPPPAYEKDPRTLEMNMPISKKDDLYSAAKAALDTHITLNSNVSPDLGCAEAVSYLLKKAGVNNIPASGFVSTMDLYHFLCIDSQFEKVQAPLTCDIIISPTGSPGAKFEHGHVGVVLNHGIGSNNSYTGKFDESLSLASWYDFYKVRGHFPVLFFRLK